MADKWKYLTADQKYDGKDGDAITDDMK